MGYSEYIHRMLTEMGVEGISFDRPGDEVAVLPVGEAWYWDIEQGVQRPWVFPLCMIFWLLGTAVSSCCVLPSSTSNFHLCPNDVH